MYMKEYGDTHCKSKMAELFDISRSGYYSFRDRPLSDLECENLMLKKKIKEIQKLSKFSIGAKPMTILLKNELGIPLGHDRVRKIMKKHDLQASKAKKAWKPKEEKDLENPAPNLLDRDFSTGELDSAWVADTSYIQTTRGWHYLCPVMDLGNREIIGWDFSKSPDTEAAARALNNAMLMRNNPEGVIFHTDRGSQFCAKEFQKKLLSNSFIISLSRRGNCWDNACIESFFRGLKHDWLYKYPVQTPEKTRELIFEYIEIIYNRLKPHGSLNMQSPVDFRKKCA